MPKRRSVFQPTTALKRPSFAERPRGPTGEGATALAAAGPPPPPAWWPPGGSLPEWYVFYWLTTRKGWQDGVEFRYQKDVDGGRAFGGLVPDFVIYADGNPPIAIMVQGLYFHEGTPLKIANGENDRQHLIRLGYDVVMTWEDDILNRLELVMELALQRQEVDAGRVRSF